MIKSLAHVCVKTRDLPETTRFYCDLLGMRRVFNFTRKGEVIGYYLEAGARTFVEVFAADAVPATSPGHALSHFCLETEQIEMLRQRLLDAGFTPGEIREGCDHSLQFWVKDPNGINFEFHQYGPESCQFTEKDVEVNWQERIPAPKERLIHEQIPG